MIAGVLMLPILVLIGDIIGICGGYMIGVSKLDFNATIAEFLAGMHGCGVEAVAEVTTAAACRLFPKITE